MNNLKYYNDSLAYDFDMFLPREKAAATAPKVAPKKNIIKLPETITHQKRRTKAQSQISSGLFAVVSTFVLVVALCFNLALRLKVNELNSQINRTKSELNTLNSESVALQMEYESRVSYANLEKSAASLGMKKLDKDQVVYIKVNEKVKAINSNGETMVANN